MAETLIFFKRLLIDLANGTEIDQRQIHVFVIYLILGYFDLAHKHD